MEKAFYISVFVLIILTLYFGLEGEIDLGTAISALVFAVTALAIGIQAFATQKMNEYQFIPAVDVDMTYDKGKTGFWFSNYSNIPAFATFKVLEEKKQIHCQTLRIPPQQKPPRRTSLTYDFNLSSGKELILDVIIKSAFEKHNAEVRFKKTYRFNSDHKRWDETTWGYPDTTPFS